MIAAPPFGDNQASPPGSESGKLRTVSELFSVKALTRRPIRALSGEPQVKKTILTATVTFLLLSPLIAEEPVVRLAEADAGQWISQPVNPVCPPMARPMHVAGKGLVHVFVSPEGSLEGANTLGGNALRTGSAVADVKQWKFTPFKANGKRVHAVTARSFNFLL